MKPQGGREALAIDIVIANHDYGRFLEAAIDSARRQRHAATNVIVVDDGSTDDSRARLDAYRDGTAGNPPVEVVLKENGGQASALNAGAERCRGDIVIFLDADDVLKPDAAERVATAFQADSELARVQYRMDVIDAEGRPTGELKPASHLSMPGGDLREAELAFPFDLVSLPTSGNAFRLDRLRRILPIPESAYPVCGADWHLVHLSSLLGPVSSLKHVCASYRVHGGNGYEPAEPRLDLDHVRQSIAYAAATRQGLARLADDLGQARPDRILSVSDLGNRLISRKLEPPRHPLPNDSPGRLLADGIRAASRRFDVSPAMRALFAAWFLATAAAPRRLARQLGEAFLFPARRASLNRFLGRLQA
jgi:glycosyltransferase involved in cell wall biosynthesis